METTESFTEGEFYQGHFNSRVYMDSFYSCPRGHTDEKDFLTFVLRSLSKTFSSGKYKGQCLVEFGSGPTIHTVLSASEWFQEIILSDFADKNRLEIEKWLKNEPDCFDWRPVIQHVCDLEGKSPLDVEVKLRQRVKRVLKCDVRLENPFHPEVLQPADCVITSLCLEAACKDMQTYSDALHRVSRLLRPAGVLIIIGVLGETFYVVDQTRFSCLQLSQAGIEDMLKKLSFTIQEFHILPGENRENNSVSDFEAVFCLVALKSPE